MLNYKKVITILVHTGLEIQHRQGIVSIVYQPYRATILFFFQRTSRRKGGRGRGGRIPASGMMTIKTTTMNMIQTRKRDRVGLPVAIFLFHKATQLVSDKSHSGISVENPGRQRSVPGGPTVRDILRQAAKCVRPYI